MTQQAYGQSYGGTLAENYQRFFSPPSERRWPMI